MGIKEKIERIWDGFLYVELWILGASFVALILFGWMGFMILFILATIIHIFVFIMYTIDKKSADKIATKNKDRKAN